MSPPNRCVLSLLLDGLEKELLGANPEELQDALRETGRARESILQEVRLALKDAADDPVIPIARYPGGRDRPGAYRH